MRRNFAEVLRSGDVSIEDEYLRLYTLFYRPDEGGWWSEDSVYQYIDYHFADCPFRGTCLSLDDFDKRYGFDFEVEPHQITIDLLVSFCEYIKNLCGFLYGSPGYYYQPVEKDLALILAQVDLVVEKIGYSEASEDGHVIFVEKNPAAISVSEIVSDDLSYKVIEYNHHSMRGDIASKREILIRLGSLLEPQRAELKRINKSLEADIFYGLNNFNIRHNNIDENDRSRYKARIADMQDLDLEALYDDLYQMILLAFLEMDNVERNKRFSETKELIER